MSTNLIIIFVIALALMVMQMIGGFLQIGRYRKAVSRCHKLGNVGMGQKRGAFFNSYVAIIACDSNRVITGGEHMTGSTIFATFKPIKDLLGKPMVGRTIDEYLIEFREMSDKKQKSYRGYINALEALEMRFDRAEEEAKQADENSAEPVEDAEYTETVESEN